MNELSIIVRWIASTILVGGGCLWLLSKMFPERPNDETDRWLEVRKHEQD